MSETSKRNHGSHGDGQGQPPADPPPPPPPVVAEAVKKSPREWAIETGNGPKTKGRRHQWTQGASPGMSRSMGSMAHEIASVLHGWGEHAHHENEPIQLTKDDYLAALKAALPEDPKDADGNPVLDEKTKKPKVAGHAKPHKGALSEHRGGRQRQEMRDGKMHKFEMKAERPSS